MRYPKIKDNKLRLYVGRKSDMKPAQVVDTLVEQDSALVVTPTGRVKILFEEKPAISWQEGQATTPLKWLNVEDNAPLVYGDMNVYKTEPLGSPCDGHLTSHQ